MGCLTMAQTGRCAVCRGWKDLGDCKDIEDRRDAEDRKNQKDCMTGLR